MTFLEAQVGLREGEGHALRITLRGDATVVPGVACDLGHAGDQHDRGDGARGQRRHDRRRLRFEGGPGLLTHDAIGLEPTRTLELAYFFFGDRAEVAVEAVRQQRLHVCHRWAAVSFAENWMREFYCHGLSSSSLALTTSQLSTTATNLPSVVWIRHLMSFPKFSVALTGRMLTTSIGLIPI